MSGRRKRRGCSPARWGVPADPCVLDVEWQDAPGGGQGYVGIFDAADVQGRYSGLWLDMSCLRGAGTVEFGPHGPERIPPGPGAGRVRLAAWEGVFEGGSVPALRSHPLSSS